MIRAIKRYCAFTKGAYRIGLLCVVFAAAFAAYLLFSWEEAAKPAAVLVAMALWVFAEGTADQWFLGGICSKNRFKLEWMQSSFYGPAFIRSVVWTDIGRRFCYNILLVGGCFAYEFVRKNPSVTLRNGLYFLTAALLCHCVTTLSFNLTRKIETAQTRMAVSGLPALLSVLPSAVIWYTVPERLMIWLSVGFGFAAVGISRFTVYYVMRYVRKMFFDAE